MAVPHQTVDPFNLNSYLLSGKQLRNRVIYNCYGSAPAGSATPLWLPVLMASSDMMQTNTLCARAVRSLTKVFSALLHAAFNLRPSYLVWLNRFEVQPLIHSYAGSSCHTGLMKLQPSLARSPSCLPSRQPSLVEQPILEVTWWQFLQIQFFGDKREVGFYIRLESYTNLVTTKVHCKSSWWM